MTQKFRLKRDARKFFDGKYSEEIQEMKWWEKHNFREELLDRVEKIYVDYGHEDAPRGNLKSTSLRSWSSVGNKAQFLFSINVLDMENRDYEKINITEMMDEIQKAINEYLR